MIDVSIIVKDNLDLCTQDKEQNLPDSTAINKYVFDYHTKLINNGYFTSTVDSLKYDTTIIKAYFTAGTKYEFVNISLSKISFETLRALRIDPGDYTKESVSLQRLNNLKEEIVTYYENNSYPFASVYLASIDNFENTLSAELIVDDLIKISIDSIHIKGDKKTSPEFLYRYIGIGPKDGYNEEKIRDIERLVNEIQFLSLIRSPEVEFYDDKADVFIYLKKKKANRFTGILGVLPNSETTGKLLLTGELDFYLINSFGKGESININWRKLESSSQNLNIDADYPFIFKSPIGIDYHFALNKKDSSYLNVSNRVGVRFTISGNNSINAFYERRVSSIITNSIIDGNAFSGYSLNVAGVGLNFRNLNNLLNPRRGYFIDSKVGVGIKKLSGGNEDNHYELHSYAGVYFPVRGNFVMHLSNRSIWLGNSQLYDNEMSLMGGLNSLRGFDEASIPVSLFSSVTIELRYLFEKNSNFFLFYDRAYYERNSFNGYVEDTPYGFGAGASFETNAGIFTLSYGVGKQFDNPLRLDNAKIHFGFKNVF